MLIYAGIDEAGYGPILGPLVVARTVFILDGCDPALPPPSLWKRLQGGVCRAAGDERGRIAVGDSKALYTPAAGLGLLERGVLSFLGTISASPGTLDALLDTLALDEGSRRPQTPCYLAPGGAPLLPRHLTPEEIARCTERLAAAGARTGVLLAEASAAVAFEERFNRLIAERGNKARCAWSFVAAHLEAIWSRFGELAPYVVVDRQGGRVYYLELLAELFPTARICVHQETPEVSRYEIIEGKRRMAVTVQVGSERRHLPAALASMTAKYLRELLMLRFQAFWSLRAPQVRPTAGYHRDGRRFLAEITPLIPPSDFERLLPVRCC